MRLATLGFDDDVLRLARWAAAGGHEWVAAFGGSERGELEEIFSRAGETPALRDWEELLSGNAVDAVIVAGAVPGAAGLAERGEQIKRLAQAGVPMVVVCPACEAIVGLEIEMIRQDLGGVIVPYVPGALHPAVNKLVGMVTGGSEGPIGAVQQISLEREQADRSREAVLRRLVRDLAVLRQLIGRVQTVTASGPVRAIGRDPMGPKPNKLPPLNNLGVVLGGDEGLTARWSVTPIAEVERGRLVVTGERGKAVLTMPANGEWSLDVAGDAFSSETFPANADVERVFWELSHSLPPEPLYDDAAWLAACRDQEAAEAVDRSLARGRTIELFHEELSEAASFKGIMAMGGCLLLVLAFCVLLLVSLVEGLQLPLRNMREWRLWPLFLLVPIGGFLLLQLLGLVVKQRTPVVQVSTRQAGPT